MDLMTLGNKLHKDIYSLIKKDMKLPCSIAA